MNDADAWYMAGRVHVSASAMTAPANAQRTIRQRFRTSRAPIAKIEISSPSPSRLGSVIQSPQSQVPAAVVAYRRRVSLPRIAAAYRCHLAGPAPSRASRARDSNHRFLGAAAAGESNIRSSPLARCP
jgi:hypothetical protein